MVEELKPLRTGVAYHGNRILRHVEEDMRDIINAGFDTVVHMFSHNDWDRHKTIMKEIFHITKELGLDVWVDNWGLGGPPGDKSHFMQYHPDSHQQYNNGKIDPIRVCLNSPDFLKFSMDWLDVVKEAGGETIFWDEPHLVGNDMIEGKPQEWSCCCPRCQKLFQEKYAKPMPKDFTPEIAQFRLETIADYFRKVSDYAKSLEMRNTICVMLNEGFGISLKTIGSICDIPSLDCIGSDPYWHDKAKGYSEVYKFVYEKTKQNLDVCAEYQKDHNVWIQTFGNPRGTEEEIIAATDAIYDAGARNIFAWGFRGSESNDYRSACPDKTWKVTAEAISRIRNRDRDEKTAFIRKQMGL